MALETGGDGIQAGGAGGGGLVLRNPADEFAGATLAIATAARNAYFADAANSDALAEFQENQSLAIVVQVTGGNPLFQTYRPGAVGDAYDAAQWLDRTDAVQGDSTLPQGSNALRELRYNVTEGIWEAVNTSTTHWVALTPLGTYDSLKALFDAVAAEDGGVGYGDEGRLKENLSSISFSNRPGFAATELTADQIYPALGPAPYFWVITPKYHGWLANITVNARVETPNDPIETVQDAALTLQSWELIVDGVPYEVGAWEWTLARPTDEQWGSMSANYTAPAQAARVVTQST